jgi:putative transposase
MARKQRVHYEGAIYHVIARGNNRDNIFKDPSDKTKYLQLLERYKHKYNCAIYAYVLMDNHIHLLISITNIPLAKIMQGLQQSYTQHYNRKYHHVGHVFQQRYKAFICNTESYLMALVCYIHQNPVRANIYEGINYAWSSHTAYMRGHHWLVDVDNILKYLSDDLQKAIVKYAEMVNQEQDASLLVLDKTDRTEPQREKESSNSIKNETTKPLTWEELVEKISKEGNICQEQLIGNCRIRKVVSARNKLIFETVNANIMTRAELASKLSVDPARITKGYQQMVEEMR